jgi:hypothetical protein|tara:strand:+ start:7214 stop:7690 length:477 start_codon:yes stop_codon:yes gene_type:complete
VETGYNHWQCVTEMQAGLVYIAGSAGKMVMSSTLTPIVHSTIGLISSLRTTGVQTVTLCDILRKHDIECTLQTIEATCLALHCDKEPLKTACANVVDGVEQIHRLLTRIADITAAHYEGYVSRWRQLNIDVEINQLENLITVLNNRFRLLCDIRSVVE